MVHYCDYDAIKHYEAGSFNVQYKTELAGKLTEIDREIYSEEIIHSFKDNLYKTFCTLEPVVLYRVFGQYRASETDTVLRGARLGGAFASTEFAESMIDAKIRLALDPKWFNTKMYEAKLVLPKDQIISVGIVAEVRLNTGTVLTGGAEQILLPQNWPEEWIIGYRRITGRQLQMPPCYTLQKPDLYDSAKNLYRPICPICGSEEMRELSATESFVVTGQRGHQYKMKYVCLNPQCEYYW
ncbi:MAG: hypothetical protein IKC03_03750 [Oscillospiraceae bacterium]|nr:hypothetical protein [Oscillospiraceae bacterium]